MVHSDVWWFPVTPEGNETKPAKYNRNPEDLMREAEGWWGMRHEYGLKAEWGRGGGEGGRMEISWGDLGVLERKEFA